MESEGNGCGDEADGLSDVVSLSRIEHTVHRVIAVIPAHGIGELDFAVESRGLLFEFVEYFGGKAIPAGDCEGGWSEHGLGFFDHILNGEDVVFGVRLYNSVVPSLFEGDFHEQDSRGVRGQFFEAVFHEDFVGQEDEEGAISHVVFGTEDGMSQSPWFFLEAGLDVYVLMQGFERGTLIAGA